MEGIDQDDPGKTVKIAESFCVLVEDFHGPLYTPRPAGLDGHTRNVRKGGSDSTDLSEDGLSVRAPALFHTNIVMLFVKQNSCR